MPLLITGLLSSSLSDTRPFVVKSVSMGRFGVLNHDGWFRYRGDLLSICSAL